MKIDLFKDHIRTVTETTQRALAANGFDGLIVHAGSPHCYHADDQEMPFRAIPHFVRFVNLPSPHHLLFITKNGDTRFVEVAPEDFWVEQNVEEKFLKNFYSVTEVKTPDGAWSALQPYHKEKTAFVGDTQACAVAQKQGVPRENCNPPTLIEALDAARARKTPYEVACIEKANERAAVGHKAAQSAFLSGESERAIHYAYVHAVGATKDELPYPTIIALNEKAATLHYQNKRADVKNGMVFLIDAGAREQGYASDITRTYAAPACDSRFTELLVEFEILQKKLVALVHPGVEFIELHHETHAGIAILLKSHDIITTDGEEAIQRGLTHAFFPHGVGHMLGIQVHDVGNHSPESWSHPLRALYPKIRTNRRLEAGNVTTIEPGIYFNEILLRPHKTGNTKEFFNWKILDSMMSCGGMRIEDNILVTESGARNLTKPYLK